MRTQNLKTSVLLTILAFSMQFALHSQVVSIDYILTGEVQKLRKLNLPTKNSALLEVEFGEPEILDKALLDSLNSGRIEKIDLVYTQYIQSETFVQPVLNRKRLEYLQKMKPFIFENNLIEWNIVCQTGAKSPEEAEKYFHGFVIHFRKRTSKDKELTTEEELKKCAEILADCSVKVGDTIRDTMDLLLFGTAVFEPVVTVDSFIRVPKGRFQGKLLKINPSSIPNKEYFERRVNRKMTTDRRDYNDTLVMETNFSSTKRIKVEGVYVPRSKRKRKKGITYEKRSMWKRRQFSKRETIKDTIFVKRDTLFVMVSADSSVFRLSCYRGISSRRFEDTIVTATFNNGRDWKNKIIVEDVTGSMYPYLTQTFLWRRLAMDSTDLSKFVYFNDGDRKPASERVIGRTGGIYSIDSPSITEIEARALQAMSAGNGGDCPENNLEALIYANKLCPSCEPLMIADNNAPIRDFVLLGSIDKPVDIILCGVRFGLIQSNYLSLVKKVGGTIYTMEGELRDLSLLKEGETIEFGRQKFIIRDGEFILTR